VGFGLKQEKSGGGDDESGEIPQDQLLVEDVVMVGR